MATTTRTAKTSAELKKQLEEAKKRIADLEKRAYAEELAEHLSATSIVNDFRVLQGRMPRITPIVILAAIGEAVGIKRLQITQAEPPKRKPADPNKPRAKRTGVK